MLKEAYDVNDSAYFESAEFQNISQLVMSIRHQRAKELLQRYPGAVINHRCPNNNDLTHYMATFNAPYYDMLCETIVHEEDAGYVDLIEFTYQTNCFAKTIFHRKMWNDNDRFMSYVWDQWQCDEFDALHTIAKQSMDTNNLTEHHRDFIYNDHYQMITVEEMEQLFDELVRVNLIPGKRGLAYKIYEGLSLEQADTNLKERYHNNKLSRIEILHAQSTYNARTRPALRQVKSKFNFIPTTDDPIFNGFWLNHRMGERVWFIPQFLVFYNDQA